MFALIHRYKNRLILSLISLVVTVLFTILLDYGVGWIFTPGLIYPPNTKITISTIEFSSVAHINHQGFRGPPAASPAALAKFRIMALGDSFTYGWGVSDEAAWPAVLAGRLIEADCPAEIANLGWVGKGPSEYADLAEKAAPLLQPDLIIVGLLQGDDLQQVSGEDVISRGYRLENLAQKVYPNISGLIQQSMVTTLGDFKPVISGEDIQTVWQNQVKDFRGRLPAEVSAHFEALDAEVQQLYMEGLINPHAVNIAIFMPNYFLEAVDMANPSTQTRIANLSLELSRLNRVASSYRATVVVVAIPQGVYVSQRSMQDRQRLGYQVAPELLTSPLPDAPFAQAAEQAQVRFLSVLEKFRQSPETLFFALDGHFTPAGHELLAESLLPILSKDCQAWQSKKK